MRALFVSSLFVATWAGATAAHAEPAVSGRWAFLQSTTTAADVPVVGKVYATTRALSLHDVTSTETRMAGPGTLCSIAIDSGTSLVETILPPALRRVLPAPVLDAKLAVRDGKLVFFQSPPPVVLGARLARPMDPLPATAEDPRVFDHDDDGAPGVTVRVQGLVSGDLHVTQRTWARYDGFLRVDGTFAGVIRHGVSQTVLGATSPFLRDPPTASPVATKSWFRLGRVSPQGGCAEAVAVAKSWLP